MTLSTHQDNFNKLDAEFSKACRDCSEAYHVWSEACDRLKRLSGLRAQAWEELLDSSVNGMLGGEPVETAGREQKR